MTQILYLNAMREGYSTDQIHRTMTVGDLICFLEQYDEDTKVYLKHDGGYTYGGITECRFEEEDDFEEEEEESD